MSLLSSLLQKLQALSSNKSQCTNALNALMEGRVACSIPGFDPSMIKNTTSTATADGINKKKKNEGGIGGMGDDPLELAMGFSGDSAMATAATTTTTADPLEDPLGP
eukprot:scaffold19629_cov67-Skeletonema_marinoi.AAC.2